MTLDEHLEAQESCPDEEERFIDEFDRRGYKDHIQFWTDPEVFNEIKELLIREYSLVPPTRPWTDCLVYEDESGEGRWRVTFVKDEESKWRTSFTSHQDCETSGRIMFRYWWARFNQEMLDKNPMKEPMEVVYKHLVDSDKLYWVTDIAVQPIKFP